MPHFYVYDTPGAIPVVPSSLPEIGTFTAATADLTAPDGTTSSIPAVMDGEEISVTLPMLDALGVWTLQVSLSGAGVSRALAPVRFPVEAVDGDGWHTVDSARAQWPGAPDDDARLFELLDVARAHCLAYAPALTGETIPANYRAGQLLQARNIWNSEVTDPNGGYGGPDGFTVSVFPLDWTVKQMLRPRRGKPVVA